MRSIRLFCAIKKEKAWTASRGANLSSYFTDRISTSPKSRVPLSDEIHFEKAPFLLAAKATDWNRPILVADL